MHTCGLVAFRHQLPFLGHSGHSFLGEVFRMVGGGSNLGKCVHQIFVWKMNMHFALVYTKTKVSGG